MKRDIKKIINCISLILAAGLLLACGIMSRTYLAFGGESVAFILLSGWAVVGIVKEFKNDGTRNSRTY